MTCDAIGIAQYHLLKSKMSAMYFAQCQNLKFFLVNVHQKTLKKRTKTVLVALIALNKSNLSEILML